MQTELVMKANEKELVEEELSKLMEFTLELEYELEKIIPSKR